MYKIYLRDDYDLFVLLKDNTHVAEFDLVGYALEFIAEIEGIKFDVKFSESYMLDVLTYNHGLQIEVLD